MPCDARSALRPRRAARTTGPSRGELSATGSPLIAGDPHLPPSMPGIWYQVELRRRRPLRPRRLAAGDAGRLHGPEQRRLLDLHQRDGRRPGPLRRAGRGGSLPVRRRVAAARDGERGDPGEGPRRARVAWRCAAPTTGRSSTRRSAPTRPSRSPCAWLTLDEPTVFAGMFELLDIDSGPQLVEKLEGHTSPASNLIWADRRGSIGYKLIGRLPLRKRRLPRPAEAGLDGRVRVGGDDPLRGAAGGRRPRERLPGHRQQPHRRRRLPPPHHQRVARRLPRQADRGAARATETSTTSRASRRCRPTSSRSRASRRRGGSAGCNPRGQRERSAIERLRSWDGRLDPDSVAGTIYQAFLLRLAREVARAAIGDRDLAERWLDRADNGFTAHVTSPWRWHSHLMKLWEEGDEELIGRPWDDLVLESLAGALDDLGDRFGPDPEGWRWGRVHEMEFPHPLGDANPLLRPPAQPPPRAPAAPRRRSARSPTTPTTPTRPSGRRAGGWSPTRPPPSARAGRCSPASRATRPARTTTTCRPTGSTGRTQPMSGEGPWSELELVPR